MRLSLFTPASTLLAPTTPRLASNSPASLQREGGGKKSPKYEELIRVATENAQQRVKEWQKKFESPTDTSLESQQAALRNERQKAEKIKLTSLQQAVEDARNACQQAEQKLDALLNPWRETDIPDKEFDELFPNERKKWLDAYTAHALAVNEEFNARPKA
jgi:hypothetical protein